jgi:hypothetical protein
MIDYTASLLWLASWPLIIYLGYKFTAFNLAHFCRLEQMNEE